MRYGYFTRKARAIVQKWGRREDKAALWDNEFRSGQWEYLKHSGQDFVYPILEKYLNGGSLLDFGCGNGNTSMELDFEVYDRYLGLDISPVAVEQCKKRSESEGRSDKNEYIVDTIEGFVSNDRFDVVLFRESLFYVTLFRIPGAIRKSRNLLKPGGVIVIRLCSEMRYRLLITLVRWFGDIVEVIRPDEPKGAVALVVR